MAELEHVLREKLAAVFARPDFYDACLRRDAGTMITILNAGGVTQGQIAARTGLAQSTLSNYKRGVNTAQFTTTFEKLADGLDMPPRLRQALGLTGDATPAGSRSAAGALAGLPADTFDLQLLAEAAGRNGTAVRRRDLLALAAQLGAGAALDQKRGTGASGCRFDQTGRPERSRDPGAGGTVGRLPPAGGPHPGARSAQAPDAAPAGGQHAAQRKGQRPARRTTPAPGRRGRRKQPARGLVGQRPGRLGFGEEFL